MDSIWEIIKLFVALISPLVAYLLWTHKRQQLRADKFEIRLSETEKTAAVIQVMINNIREDIVEIKQGVEKLIDRK
jgi:ferric iron reductase protein FhuF